MALFEILVLVVKTVNLPPIRWPLAPCRVAAFRYLTWPQNRRIKIMYVRFFIFCSLACIFSLVGCPSVEDCGPFPSHFNVKGLNSESYRITNFTQYQAYSVTLATAAPVRADSFMLGITFTYEDIYANRLTIPKAYACSPKIPTSNEIVESIVITSNQAFDDSHLAGDTLNDIFEIVYLDFDGTEYSYPMSIDQFVSSGPTAKKFYYLSLKSSPLKAANHNFSVYYKQTNGETYQDSTATIYLTPY